MTQEKPAILAQDLTKDFGSFRAVDRISFSVGRGEIFGFLGPNGSGKTTTIRMILGLLQPTAGSARVLDLDVRSQIRSLLPRIGYMSQQFSLYNDITVEQNLAFYSRAYGIPGRKTAAVIKQAVDRAGLAGFEEAPTHTLSGGWRQRLALSAAILHQPEVLFLDEPTAGVDPVSRRAFWDLLYNLVSSGITVFITTHYMDEAEHCHKLAFIQHGRIIASGTPDQIKQNSLPSGLLEISTGQPEELMRIIRKARDEIGIGDLTLELFGREIHAVTTQPAAAAKSIRKIARKSKIQINSISEIEPSLEDVFIACMGTSPAGGNHET